VCSSDLARIIVTGCYAQMAPETVLNLAAQRVFIIGNGNKHLLVDTALAERQSDLVMLMGQIRCKTDICDLPVRHFSGRTRAWLRIQDGCNNFCSYCIVPFTRGRSRSLPLVSVLRQAEVFAGEGYREMVVTGINVGKYGLDLVEGETIYTLLERLCTDFPAIRLRLSSIEPTEVNDRLLGIAIGHANFMPHFHIPLQSGDDAVLARMNRRYSRDAFAAVINQVHTVLPEAAIGCDVMGGFPGETDQEADNTFQLLADLPVSYLHVFPYSRRPGTLAAASPQQLPGPVKGARVARLRTLGEDKRRAFQQRHLGRVNRVLVERRNKKNGLLQGFSENYIPLLFPGSADRLRKVVAVRLEELRDGRPFGCIVEELLEEEDKSR
ncbi:MAG: MiaB/RimO family radical SAM methylthiotransferase, partial [Desulfobulbus sp.]|jgi:threonylcarbamoyladenosine tRNA methylthiotransferase MtaB|nr:MiaB/RimO family radical SAM methylthiotransferase [Desulfobulbus sp.]